MNYYFISSDDGSILESGEYVDKSVLIEDCQAWANACDCEVWVIKGEHSGISCLPDEEGTIPPGTPTIDNAKELGFDTVEEYQAAYNLEAAKMAHWMEHGSLAGFEAGR